MVSAQSPWEKFIDLAIMPPGQIELDRSALLLASIFDPKLDVELELKNMDILVKSTTLNHENLISILIIKICQGYYG